MKHFKNWWYIYALGIILVVLMAVFLPAVGSFLLIACLFTAGILIALLGFIGGLIKENAQLTLGSLLGGCVMIIIAYALTNYTILGPLAAPVYHFFNQ